MGARSPSRAPGAPPGAPARAGCPGQSPRCSPPSRFWRSFEAECRASRLHGPSGSRCLPRTAGHSFPASKRRPSRSRRGLDRVRHFPWRLRRAAGDRAPDSRAGSLIRDLGARGAPGQAGNANSLAGPPTAGRSASSPGKRADRAVGKRGCRSGRRGGGKSGTWGAGGIPFASIRERSSTASRRRAASGVIEADAAGRDARKLAVVPAGREAVFCSAGCRTAAEPDAGGAGKVPRAIASMISAAQYSEPGYPREGCSNGSTARASGGDPFSTAGRVATSLERQASSPPRSGTLPSSLPDVTASSGSTAPGGRSRRSGPSATI